ncbi:MAG: hypothetical protein NXH75_14280 [Halobacteriovoraceae bacterium]|nr:hypothetical protein [Halobacteriovoraceae bacterium]
MKFIRRPAVIQNGLVFCLLSLLYLSIVESIHGGVSALDTKLFLEFLKRDQNLVIMASIAFLTILRGFKFSSYVFLAFCLTILVNSFSLFFIGFNKVILLLNFIYAIVAYNLFLFLRLELSEPFYNPMFPKNMMPEFSQKRLPIVIKHNGKSLSAYLTNWGEEGFFCKLESPVKSLRGTIEIEILFETFTFFAKGIVTTQAQDGFGVRITKSPVPDLGWPEYYGIIKELGYRPSLG